MSMRKLQLRPGVNTQLSPTLNEAGISDSQLIRFPFGLPEKQGGWRIIPNIAPLQGTCRGLFGWADYTGQTYLAAGTEQRLEVVTGGVLSDITPVRAETNPPASGFSATPGSNLITVHDPANGAVAGDWIHLHISIAVGGTVLQYGDYQIQSVIDGNTYTILAPAAATSSAAGVTATFTTTNGSSSVVATLPNHGLAVNAPIDIQVPTTVGGITISGPYTVTAPVTTNTLTIVAATAATSTATASENGGNAQIHYLLASGFAFPTYLGGWGVGDFGMGDWGTGSAGSLLVPARQWSLFNFGQDLIASPSGGAIYYWPPPTPDHATVVDPSAPTQNTVVFGMGQTEIVIAAGTNALGTFYPTLVRWCDSGDFTDWTASATNQAGSYQIPTGSMIIAGLAVGLGALIWTDVDLWSMSYMGFPLVFSWNRIGIACEPLGVKAVAVVPGNLIAWPGPRGFFIESGGSVSPLACTVWDIFFKNLDPTRQSVVRSAVNALFSEVGWYYDRLDGQIGYVRWNYQANLWDHGILDRTAWTDLSPFGPPIGSDSQGYLYRHETGNDADSEPMEWSFTTGYFDLQDGADFTFVDFVIPDFVGSYTAIQLTLMVTDAPNVAPKVYGPYTLSPTTPYLNVRVRGRQMAMTFAGNDADSEVRLAAVRYRFAPAGRR